MTLSAVVYLEPALSSKDFVLVWGPTMVNGGKLLSRVEDAANTPHIQGPLEQKPKGTNELVYTN